jgi:enamine deaminase RidA (YjgF/YER057c/UK114 family)
MREARPAAASGTSRCHERGRYSPEAARTVEVAPGSRWLAITATPAIDADGTAAGGVMEQAAVAWANLERALEAAKYTRHDLVSITQYVTIAAEAPACERVRIDRLDGVRPACKLIVVAGLTHPNHRVLIEAWPAKAHPQLTPQEWHRQAVQSSDLGYRDTDELYAYIRHQGDVDPV